MPLALFVVNKTLTPLANTVLRSVLPKVTSNLKDADDNSSPTTTEVIKHVCLSTKATNVNCAALTILWHWTFTTLMARINDGNAIKTDGYGIGKNAILFNLSVLIVIVSFIMDRKHRHLPFVSFLNRNARIGRL